MTPVLPQAMKARIGDIEIAYETSGHGPPLVAIMGLSGTRGHWRGFPERFADRHRIVTFENRGAGDTSAPMGPYSTAQMARDTLGLMDHLAIDAAVIFGVSMGGMIAQELALVAPERVTKLVLGCTSMGGPSSLTADAEVLAEFSSLGRGGAEASLRRLVALNFSQRFLAERPDVIDELVAYGLTHRLSGAAFKGQIAAVATHDTASRVNAIHAKTLLLSGEVDRLIPSDNSALLAARIDGSRRVELAGVGHMFWIEAADAAEQAMQGFLNEA
jgi:pimeloyl-ACP methyl ester carboxylesterase